jgi:hypothetical protein
MTQVKCRSVGGKGLSQEAWKYLLRRECAKENIVKFHREKKERAEAEARKNITLPKLKWMDRPF